MVSEQFRQQLRKEAEQWQAEGLIDASVFDQLAQRYQFDALETDSQNRFVIILLGLGAILLGLGIITFVAANWQGWSRGGRVALLLTLFLIVNIAGFVGWQSWQGKWQRLGKALLLLGALILGANLALMSQMFHQSGAVYELYLVWGTGVLAMAYGLQLSWLATLAIVLVGIGYWWQFPGILNMTQTGKWVPYMPLLAMGLFLPLAKRCQSSWVLVWAVVAVVSSFEVTLMQQLAAIYRDSPLLAGGIAMAGLSLPPLLLWGYENRYRRPPFKGIPRRLSILFLAAGCYWFSFHRIWRDVAFDNSINAAVNYFPVLFQVFLFGGLTVYTWWQLGKTRNAPWRLSLTSTLVAVTSLITGLVASWGVVGIIPSDVAWIPTAIYNLILLFLAIALVRQGLNQSIRLHFWAGLSLLTLQIISRMLEYHTGLIFKSVILVLCGFAIVIAGLWFERYLGQHS